jgi:hypothetical protein
MAGFLIHFKNIAWSDKKNILVRQEKHNIRSPQTVKNIQRLSDMEVCFLYVLSRRAFRAKGKARYIERSSEEFRSMISKFEKWSDLVKTIKGIVVLKVVYATEIKSPIYDISANERELREQWKQYYQNL